MQHPTAERPNVIPAPPDSVIAAARLRRDDRLADAVAVVETELGAARSGSFDVPFRNRVLLALTLADLYVLAGQNDRARGLLNAEIPFAEQVFELMKQGGSAGQIHAASAGVLQLRDRAAQLALIGQRGGELEVSDWISGPPTSLDEQRGRVVLIEFWAPRCRSCAAMFEFFNTMHARHGPRGLTVVALTSYRGRNGDRVGEHDLIRKAVAEHAVEFRVGVAPDQRLQKRYGATGVPTFVLVDRAGVVRLASSKPDKAALEDAITRLLAADAGKPSTP